MVISMLDLYTTDLEARKQIYHSPLLATLDQLKGLPPALIVVFIVHIILSLSHHLRRRHVQSRNLMKVFSLVTIPSRLERKFIAPLYCQKLTN